jgi:hypothetical protein
VPAVRTSKRARRAQQVHEQLDDLRVVVDDEHAFLLPSSASSGMPLVHEADQLFTRDAPELRARHAEALQTPAVEAADDRLLADLAHLRGLAGGEDPLVAPVLI